LPILIFFIHWFWFWNDLLILGNLGVEDGQTVRMPVGKKEIFITFRVEKSDYFKRDGPDVHSETTISIAQAILGGSTRIQGIYENMTIDVSKLHLAFINVE